MKTPSLAILCSAIGISSLFSQDSQRVMTGTGFYVGQNTIITCAHVVAGAQVVQVVDAHQIRKTAKVAVLDPVSDIAVLRVPGTSPGTLAIAKADAAGVMDPIIVVGFPLASAIGTEISASEGRINAIRQTVNGPIIQLDAAVNHGDSVGPVWMNMVQSSVWPLRRWSQQAQRVPLNQQQNALISQYPRNH